MVRSRTAAGRVLAVLIVLTPAATVACGASSVPPIPPTTGTINIGLGDNTPGFSAGEPPAGFDVAFKDRVVDELGDPDPPEFSKGVNAPNREPYLLGRKVTWIVASYSITTDRNQAGIDFAGPYMQSDQGLLIRADDRTIRDRASLAGKSVCMVSSTTPTRVRIPGANTGTKRLSNQQCIDMLSARDTDAVFTDSLILYGFMQANPGKFRLVLPGVFGTTQYYGIGMLGGHPEECRRLNEIIKDYLRVQWRIDFQAHLPAAVTAAAADPTAGGFESRYKPSEATMQRLACKVTKEPPRPL